MTTEGKVVDVMLSIVLALYRGDEVAAAVAAERVDDE